MGVALSSKMYVPQGVQVPCVNLAADVDLDDIHPWAADLDTAQKMVSDGTAPSLFYFVENAKQLEKKAGKLAKLWEQKINFWLFYPKAPHLQTDLSRDNTWKLMKQQGMQGTRQVGIDARWSCMYFKNTGKSDYVEIIPG